MNAEKQCVLLAERIFCYMFCNWNVANCRAANCRATICHAPIRRTPVFTEHSRITLDEWPLIEWPNADAGSTELLVVDRSENAALERLAVVAKTA